VAGRGGAVSAAGGRGGLLRAAPGGGTARAAAGAAGGDRGPGRRLPPSFFARPAPVVARDLLGKVVVRVEGGARRAARLVEVEAYHGPDDRASHARAGPTPRAAIMFGPPGVAYVYLIYGRNHCLNLVTGAPGEPSAVLLRAAEPLSGCLHSPRGPGNLCRALGVTRARHDGMDLGGDELWVEEGPPPGRVVATARVGVASAGPRWARRRWRFVVAGSRWASGRGAA
jgi:DNA-3-methyladenine glycosylase